MGYPPSILCYFTFQKTIIASKWGTPPSEHTLQKAHILKSFQFPTEQLPETDRYRKAYTCSEQ